MAAFYDDASITKRFNLSSVRRMGKGRARLLNEEFFLDFTRVPSTLSRYVHPLRPYYFWV